MAYGQYEKARPLAERALETARQSNASDGELALCLIDLAGLYKGLQDFNRAEEVCRLGLELQKKSLYDGHPYVAHTLRILSSILIERGRPDIAEDRLAEAEAIMLESHEPLDKAMIPFWVDRARLALAEGDLQTADEHFERALEQIMGSYGPRHLYTAGVMAGMAEMRALQGRLAEAGDYIDKALAIQERIYGPDNHLVTPSWLTKAALSLAAGDQEQARKLIRKARAAVTGTNNPRAVASFEQRAQQLFAGRPAYGPVAYGSM
jgi:tetratricopeptide (TPR) repeat protein